MSVRYRIGMLDPKQTGAFSELLPEDFVPNDASTVLLGATKNGYAAGVLWGEFSDDDCEIMQIAVHPAFRHQGIGSALVRSFLSAFRRMERLMPVYMHFVCNDENRGLYSFLSATGLFTFFEETTMYRISGDQRLNCKGYQKMKKTITEPMTPFFSLPLSDRQAFVEENIGVDPYFPDDLLTGKKLYEDKLCLCHVEDHKVIAAVFVRSDGEMLHVRYLHGNDNQGILRYLLSAAIKEADYYYPDMDIQAEAAVPSVKKLFDVLADGNPEEIPVMMAMWNMVEP